MKYIINLGQFVKINLTILKPLWNHHRSTQKGFRNIFTQENSELFSKPKLKKKIKSMDFMTKNLNFSLIKQDNFFLLLFKVMWQLQKAQFTLWRHSADTIMFWSKLGWVHMDMNIQREKKLFGLGQKWPCVPLYLLCYAI